MWIQEDIITKLFEFLEAPQATTSELLADKELASYIENSYFIVQNILIFALHLC